MTFRAGGTPNPADAPTVQKCASCKFFVPWPPETYGADGMAHDGGCRRFPPASMRGLGETDRDVWCGEWAWSGGYAP